MKAPPPVSEKVIHICRKELIDGYLRKLTLKRYSSCALSLSKKLPSGLPSRSASASYLKIVFVTVLCLNSLLNISTCPFSPSKKSSQLFGRGQAPSDERSPPDFGLSWERGRQKTLLYLSMWPAWHGHICHLFCSDFHLLLLLLLFLRCLKSGQLWIWHPWSRCQATRAVKTRSLFPSTELSTKILLSNKKLACSCFKKISTSIEWQEVRSENKGDGETLEKVAALLLHSGSCLHVART